MEIRYAISPNPGLLEDMVAKAYEAQSPLAEVASITLPTPHTFPANVVFNGLDRVVHIIRLFTQSGTLLHEYDQNPVENVVTVFDPIYFKIGDGQSFTPIAGVNIWSYAPLAGVTNAQMRVWRDGQLKYPGIHYDALVGGGIQLLQAGDIFETDAEWMVERSAQVIPTVVNDSVVAKIFGGFLDVNNTEAHYDATHLRKLVRLSGLNGKYYFDSGVPVPIGYSHTFSNFGPYASVSDTPGIYFNNAALLFGNATINFFPLPFKGTVQFTFDGTNWNLVTYQNAAVGPTAFGRIVHMGRQVIGDISIQGSATVFIPAQADTNYWVVAVSRGLQANIDLDNDVFFTVAQFTTTSFVVIFREIQGFVQNLQFDYAILRAN